MKLILASGSKNRKEALTLARIPFTAIPSDIDEAAIYDGDVKKRVMKIAKAKVEKISKSHQGLIFAGDGVNRCEGKVLEKPKSKNEAIEMLKLQSGKTCSFLTGYFILNTKTKKRYQGTVETMYTFRKLTVPEIKEYVEKENVYQWAAAFSPANSMAIRFVKNMNGSYSNFNYSVPLERIIPIFQKEGVLQ